MENKKKRRRRFGYRSDGRLLRSLNPMQKLMPYIMPQRSDGCNSFRGEIELDAIEQYVREKRESGLANFTTMHVLLAAYTRLVSQRPGLNRYISGQKIYARNHFETMLCMEENTLYIAGIERSVSDPFYRLRYYQPPHEWFLVQYHIDR